MLSPRMPAQQLEQLEAAQQPKSIEQQQIEITADALTIHIRCDQLRLQNYLLCLAMQQASIRYHLAPYTY